MGFDHKVMSNTTTKSTMCYFGSKDSKGWASTQSDQSLDKAHKENSVSPILLVHTKDSDQTEQMFRLI